jgi:PKD repeat protein
MKKFFSLLGIVLFLFVFQTVTAQKHTYSDPWSEGGFKLKSTTDKAVSVDFSITEFSFEDITVDGQVMKNVTLPGSFLFNDEGAPNLPGNGRYIAIPQGSTPKLKITSFRIERIQNVDVVPAPRIPLENEEGELVYKKNMAIYAKNNLYPAEPVKISSPSKLRGVDVVMLGITPFQYNPVTKELVILRDLKVEITFEGGNGHFGEDRLRSRFWDPILEDALLNYASLPVIDYDARVQNVSDVPGYEYLIITPTGPAFTQWADSIRRFRIQQGISTVVKTLTEVGGNTTTAIESYINTAYNTWSPAPAAVLLLGDYGLDPTCSVVSPIYASYCVSDNIYGDVDNDQLPEVCMARITANNAAQLQVMCSKDLNYERNPPTAANFYLHPITALGWQTERWFQICSEVTGGFWKWSQGKDPVRINEVYSGTPGSIWSSATNTSTVVNYFGPSGTGYIPSAPSSMPCCWTGGNATQVNNALNAGAFCLMHRDHGYELGWGEPSYSNTNIDGLTNTNLSFIFSINCLTGKYNYGSECFAEKFHRYTYNGQNAGALGLIAASEISYSFVNDTYLWGMMDNFWPSFMPTYGTTPASRGFMPCFGNAAGKIFLEQSGWPYNTSDKEVTYHLFHHHGDAFMTVYSEVPQNLTVTHSSTINAGATLFQITSNAGSFIALTLGDQILGTATGTGTPIYVVIPGTLVVGQTVRVTVTLQNYFRYGSDVLVVPNGGPQVEFSADSTAICTGQNVDYTDLSTGNPTSWNWSFPGGNPASSTAQNPQNIVYSAPGSYSVTLSATNAVSTNSMTKTGYITVTGPAGIPGIPDGDTALCVNNPNTFYTIMPVSGGITYTWVLSPDSAGVVTATDTSCIINWSDTYTGFAYLKVQAANGCGPGAFSPELPIHVRPFPDTPGTPAGLTSMCQGSSATTEYTVVPAANATTYDWKVLPAEAGTVAGNGTTGTVTWTAAFNGGAQVSVKAENQCNETPYSTPLDVTIYANPVADLGEDITIPQTETATLDAGNPGAEYLWSNGGTTQTITVGYEGNPADSYSVTVTMNGCQGSDEVTVNYSDPTGISVNPGEFNIRITPNPNSGIFRIELSSASEKKINIRILNILGASVFDRNDIIVKGTYSSQIDISKLPDGLYYLTLSGEVNNVTRKLVLRH